MKNALLAITVCFGVMAISFAAQPAGSGKVHPEEIYTIPDQDTIPKKDTSKKKKGRPDTLRRDTSWLTRLR